MRYALSFKFNSKIAYPFVFYSWVRGVYPLYFYGYSVTEIIKYTHKYAEPVTGIKNNLLRKLAASSELVSFMSMKGIATLDMYDCNDVEVKLSELRIPVSRLAQLYSESYVESLKQTQGIQVDTEEYVKEILYNTVYYVDAVYQRDIVDRKYKDATLIRKLDISERTLSHVESMVSIRSISGCYVINSTILDGSKIDHKEVSHTVVVNALSSKSTESNNKLDILYVGLGSVEPIVSIRKEELDSIEPLVLIDKDEHKSIEPLVLVDKDEHKSIEPRVEISDYTFKGISRADTEEILRNLLSEFELGSNTQVNLVQHTTIESGNELEVFSNVIDDAEFASNVLEAVAGTIVKHVDSEDTLEASDNTFGGVEKIIPNTATKGIKRVITYLSNLLKHKKDTDVDTEHIETRKDYSDADYSDILVDKQELPEIEPLVEVRTEKLPEIEPLVEVRTQELPEVAVVVDTRSENPLSVHAVVDTFTNHYTDVQFGKLWRFKDGGAFDKIWINPTESDVTEIANYRKHLVDKLKGTVAQIIETSDSYYNVRKKINQIALQANQADDMSEVWTMVTEFLEMFDDRFDELSDYEEIHSGMSTLISDFAIHYKNKHIDHMQDRNILAVEARISFKAMLDFILFTEQLVVSNRFFYGASRAVTAIDDMVRILTDWVTDGRPSEEGAEQYDYLVRWYKWWADSERAKHIDDMELNGIQVLYTIRDHMVNYFESRWGKRIVEYGVDDMYIYSEDFSFIDRIRGKKHGNSTRLVDKKTMQGEYGLTEDKLPFDVETETKGKRS